MVNIDGSKNKDSCTWSKEKRRYRYAYARKHRNTGYEGRRFRYQQKRTNRANGSDSKILNGDSTAGGMLRHLISDYREQVAKLSAEIARMSSAKDALELKIKDLELLENEINNSLRITK